MAHTETPTITDHMTTLVDTLVDASLVDAWRTPMEDVQAFLDDAADQARPMARIRGLARAESLLVAMSRKSGRWPTVHTAVADLVNAIRSEIKSCRY